MENAAPKSASVPPDSSAKSAPAASPAPEVPPSSALDRAVHKCCAAYERAFAAERGRGGSKFDAWEKGHEAYRKAMPFLTSEENIAAFIACVAYAMVVDVIRADGKELLSAAHAARLAMPRPARPVGRPRTGDDCPLPEK